MPLPPVGHHQPFPPTWAGHLARAGRLAPGTPGGAGVADLERELLVISARAADLAQASAPRGGALDLERAFATASGQAQRLLAWVFERGRRIIMAFAAGLAPLRPDAVPVPPTAPSPPPPGAAEVPALPASARRVEARLAAATDPAAALQQAIDALGPAGGVVQLPPGTFALARPVELRANVHVAGVPGQTFLRPATTAFKATGVADVSIRDLVVDGGQFGVEAANSQRLGVYRCTFRNLRSEGPFGAGTAIMGSAAVVGARIIGNTIHDCGAPGSWASGVRLAWGSSDAVVTDNRIARVARNGIVVNDGGKNAYIARNDVRDMTGPEGLGIELWRDCSGIVEDNTLSSWLSFDASAGIIRRNTVDGSWNSARRPPYGIEVVAGDGVQVLDNVVRNVAMGLSIDRTRRSTYRGNLVERVGVGAQGLGQKGAADGNVLVGNTFRDGSGRGVFLNANCHDWRIEDNVIERFRASGVYLLASDGLTLRGNALRQTATAGGSEAAIYWNGPAASKRGLVLAGNTLAGNGRDYDGVPAIFLGT